MKQFWGVKSDKYRLISSGRQCLCEANGLYRSSSITQSWDPSKSRWQLSWPAMCYDRAIALLRYWNSKLISLIVYYSLWMYSLGPSPVFSLLMKAKIRRMTSSFCWTPFSVRVTPILKPLKLLWHLDYPPAERLVTRSCLISSDSKEFLPSWPITWLR